MNIAFDIGEVLFRVDMDKFYKKLIYWECVENLHQANKLISEVEKLSYLGINKVSSFLHSKFPYISEEIFLKEWNKIIQAEKLMLDLVENLCDSGTKVALLSNIGTEHAAHLREHYPNLMNKTINHLSCEVGSFKPQKLFFQSFLMENGGEWRFFDDRQENLKIAGEIGFNTTLFNLNDFKDDMQLKEYIRIEF